MVATLVPTKSSCPPAFTGAASPTLGGTAAENAPLTDDHISNLSLQCSRAVYDHRCVRVCFWRVCACVCVCLSLHTDFPTA